MLHTTRIADRGFFRQFGTRGIGGVVAAAALVALIAAAPGAIAQQGPAFGVNGPSPVQGLDGMPTGADGGKEKPQIDNQAAPGQRSASNAQSRPATPAPARGADRPVTKELLDQVVALANKSELAGAITLLDGEMRAKGEYTGALILRGRAQCELRKFDLCIADMTRAIDINRNSADSFLWRARMYAFNLATNRENVTAALADFTDAERLAPQAAAIHFHRGRMFQIVTNEPDRALVEYDLTIARDPKVADAHANKLDILLARGSYDAALKASNDAIVAVPNEPSPYAVRALVMMSRKDAKSARVDLDKSIALTKGRASLPTQLAATAMIAATIIDRNGSIITGAR